MIDKDLVYADLRRRKFYKRYAKKLGIRNPYLITNRCENMTKTDERKGNSNSVGAAWKKKTSTGEDYLSIQLNEKPYFGFTNKSKKKDSDPDMRVKRPLENDPKKSEDCGAGWLNTSDKVGKFFSLDVEQKRYMMFLSKFKTDDKHPDYYIIKAQDNQEGKKQESLF